MSTWPEQEAQRFIMGAWSPTFHELEHHWNNNPIQRVAEIYRIHPITGINILSTFTMRAADRMTLETQLWHARKIFEQGGALDFFPAPERLREILQKSGLTPDKAEPMLTAFIQQFPPVAEMPGGKEKVVRSSFALQPAVPFFSNIMNAWRPTFDSIKSTNPDVLGKIASRASFYPIPSADPLHIVDTFASRTSNPMTVENQLDFIYKALELGDGLKFFPTGDALVQIVKNSGVPENQAKDMVEQFELQHPPLVKKIEQVELKQAADSPMVKILLHKAWQPCFDQLKLQPEACTKIYKEYKIEGIQDSDILLYFLFNSALTQENQLYFVWNLLNSANLKKLMPNPDNLIGILKVTGIDAKSADMKVAQFINGDFALQGKENLTDSEMIEGIKKLHKKIGWEKHNKLSLERLQEITSVSVFAVSTNKDIIGYATAKKGNDTNYQLSFFAVENERFNDVALQVFLRLLEKIKAKGFQRVIVEYRNNAKWNNLYGNTQIPYKRNLEQNIGHFADGEEKNKMTYNLV